MEILNGDDNFTHIIYTKEYSEEEILINTNSIDNFH